MDYRKCLVVMLVVTVCSACGAGGQNPAAGACVKSEAIRAVAADHAAFLETSLADPQKLHGHVLAAALSALDHGKVEDAKPMEVTVSLSPANETQLAVDVMSIYQPGNPAYHHFLSPSEFRARYAPSSEQIAQVTAYLQSQGFSGITPDANGFLVHATGSAHVVSSAFNTEIHSYSSKSQVAFFAPAYELQVPSRLSIQGVLGLQNLTKWHTHARQASTRSSSPRAGSGANGGYSASDIRTAYNVPSVGGGAGQMLGLFELDGYTASDVTNYEKAAGGVAVPLQNILVDGATGVPGGGAAEVTLDIELMTAIAPNAAGILVYEGPDTETGMLDTYSRIASDNLASTVSSSWGSSEDSVGTAFLQSENTVFMQMAAQGQTIFSAAGDSGAYDDGSTLSVDDPSSQPYVVAVGGTTLSTTTATEAWLSETTWNDSGSGGGGGISNIWPIPAWQVGLATSQNQGSSTMRNTPDVALHADENTGYAIYYQGGWSVWGGTSCAAPLWAAFTALVNEERGITGLPRIGFMTPTLYALGKSGSYNEDFHDIKDGSTNEYYPAVAGYDNATGWGSFNGAHLLSDLVTEVAATGAGTALSSTGVGVCGN